MFTIILSPYLLACFLLVRCIRYSRWYVNKWNTVKLLTNAEKRSDSSCVHRIRVSWGKNIISIWRELVRRFGDKIWIFLKKSSFCVSRLLTQEMQSALSEGKIGKSTQCLEIRTFYFELIGRHLFESSDTRFAVKTL